MISIVCVYNNEDILNNWLLKSLKNQTAEFELITLDNTRNGFKSAAEALNYGGNKATGKYIMFVHQDVDLSSDTWLEDVEKMLDSITNLGIAGVAGKCENGKGVMTIIEHGSPPRLAGEIYIDKPTKVQTLDECLVIIRKSVFDMLQFDERVCDNWHLYAVDYCLSVARLGLSAYAIPMLVYHKSTGASNKNRFQTILSLGSLPDEYYQTLRKLLQKHKNHVNPVRTTMGDWSTSQPLIWQRMVRLTIYLLIELGFGYVYRKSGLKYLWKKLEAVIK